MIILAVDGPAISPGPTISPQPTSPRVFGTPAALADNVKSCQPTNFAVQSCDPKLLVTQALDSPPGGGSYVEGDSGPVSLVARRAGWFTVSALPGGYARATGWGRGLGWVDGPSWPSCPFPYPSDTICNLGSLPVRGARLGQSGFKALVGPDSRGVS